MAYHEFLLATPHSYAAVAAIAFGLGVAGLIPGRNFRLRDAKARARRLARLYVCLSVAIAVATAGILVLELSQLKNTRLLHTAAVAFGISVAVFRFPRTLGSLVFLAAILLAGLIATLSSAWYPPDPTQPEGELRVLRAGGGTMVIEHVPTHPSFQEPGRIFTLSGTTFAVEVEVLSFSEYLFFVGASDLYRLRSMHSRAGIGEAGGDRGEEARITSEPFPQPQLVVAAWLGGWLRDNVEAIPGVQLTRLRSAWTEPRPLERYTVEVTPTSVQLLWDKLLREALLLDDTVSSDDDHALSGR